MAFSNDKKFLGRPQGQPNASGTWTRTPVSASSIADLQSAKIADLSEGEEVTVDNIGRYKWSSASVLAAEAVGNLVVVPTEAPAAGRWLFLKNQILDIAVPFTFSQADASVIFTVPTGCKLQLVSAYYLIATSFAGGSSSAIGLKGGAATGMTTAGDILGGAGGDLAATLVSTNAFAQGTVGAKMGKPAAVLAAADTVIYNKIASAFTAGVGTIHLAVAVIANAGV